MIGLLLAAAAALHPVAATPRRAPAPAVKAADIELWVLDQISFPLTQTPADAATLKALEPDHTMEAVATRLALLGIKFQRDIITVDASKLPAPFVANVRGLPPTEPFAVPTPGRMTVSVVLSRRTVPASQLNRAPPPPPAPNPGAAAGVDRLLDVMDVAAQFDTQVTRMIDAVTMAVVADNKDRTDEARTIVGEELRTSLLKTRPMLLAQTRELYLARFSAAELGQLVAFYETPLGRKLTSMSPGIGAAMAQFSLEMGRAAAADAQPRIQSRLRAANIKPVQGV